MPTKLACVVVFICAFWTAALAAAENYRHPEVADLKPGIVLYRELGNDKYEALGAVTKVTEQEVFWRDSEGRREEKSASVKDVAKYWFIAAEKS